MTNSSCSTPFSTGFSTEPISYCKAAVGTGDVSDCTVFSGCAVIQGDRVGGETPGLNRVTAAFRWNVLSDQDWPLNSVSVETVPGSRLA